MQYAVGKAGQTELFNHAYAPSLEALQLDDDPSIGYTYKVNILAPISSSWYGSLNALSTKAMGAGLYCLEHYDDFEEVAFQRLTLCSFTSSTYHKAISDLTFEAGDADSNGAVAGALLGKNHTVLHETILRTATYMSCNSSGAKLGYSKLPTHWINVSDDISQLCLIWFDMLFFRNFLTKSGSIRKFKSF